ncbi:MAG: hypothetical protein ACTH2Y_10555 [Corynebacterium sp.]|uniref:hypothetical protein n=1 Tax=Corynebacterium sp. TaxID=1720 RepID=UPI003F8EB968
MANPAELLHDLFVSWNATGTSASAARKDPDLVQHRNAVRYLGEIDELLEIAKKNKKRVGTYRSYFPLWVKTVFNYPGSWGGQNTAKIDQNQIDQLDNLIDMIDGFVVSPDKETLDQFREYVRLIEWNLDEDESLSPAVRESARAVCVHMLSCVDNLAVTGSFEFGKAFERLLGVLATVTLRSSQRSRWRTVVDFLVWPYAVANLPQIEEGRQFLELMVGTNS